MDAAHEQGINFFDTANDYGRHAGRGRTEEIIGAWLAQGGGRRERTVLSTKVYAGMGEWPNEGKLSALNIRRALDASLRRLRTDYIDLYQFHHVDRAAPWEEIWQAIDVAIRRGKIIYVGSSNFGGWHIAQAQAAATQLSMLGLVSEQSIYSLFRRTADLEVIPAARHYGLGIPAWSPLYQRLLAGVLTVAREGRRRLEGRAAAALHGHREQVEQYEALASKLGLDPAVIALAWLLSRPGITAPVIGPRTMEQLASAVRAIGIPLDGDVLAHLDEIFPGHSPAPEDYAW